MPKDNATYDRVWRDLYVSLMGGIRIYYPQPKYFMQEQLGRQCCTVLKMKQLVPAGLLHDLRNAEYSLKDQKGRKVGLDLYANRLKDHVASCKVSMD